jgi:hypothetical protein
MTNSSPLADISLAEFLAFYFKQHGAEKFREMLVEIGERGSNWLYRGWNRKIIQELRSVGIVAAADILEEWDENLPHRWELPPPGM